MPFTLSLQSFRAFTASDVAGRVSTSSGGGQASGDSVGPVISGNGRYVVFASSAENLVPEDDSGKSDVFRKDLWTGAVVLVTTNAQGGRRTVRVRMPLSAQTDA